MTGICPSCGYDLLNDEVISTGSITSDPRGDVVWNGVPIPLTRQQRVVLHSLLKADGRTLSMPTLESRMGYEGDKEIVPVIICKIRRRLHGAAGIAPPIENVRGRGYRWAA